MSRHERVSLTASTTFAYLALVLSLINAAGWIFSRSALIGTGPHVPVIAPFTVILLILCSVTTLLEIHLPPPLRARSRAIGAVLICFFSLIALVELVTGEVAISSAAAALLRADLQLLGSEQPIQPAPNTSLALLLLGIGILLFERKRSIAQISLFTSLVIALVGLILSAIRVVFPATIPESGSLVGMSMPAAAAILLLTSSLIAARPQDSWLALAMREGASGELLRRAILGAVAIPLIFVSLIVIAPDSDLGSLSIVYLLVVLALIGTFAATIWSSAVVLLDVDRLRAENERRFRSDIANQRRQERNQRILARASQELSQASDFDACADACTRVIVPDLVDWAYLYLVGESGKLEIRAIKHADRRDEELLVQALSGHSVHETSSGGVLEILHSGRPLWIEEFDLNRLPEILPNRQTAELLRLLRLKSYAIFPLVARNHTIGAIVMATGRSGRRLEVENQPLFENLAYRMAINLDNARLLAEAKNAAQVREDILAVVSHDLKNPLSTIKVFSQMVRDQGQALGASLKDVGAQLVGSTATMESLVRNILDLGKLSRGVFELDRETTSLRSVVAQVDIVFRPLANAKGLGFAIDPGPDIAIEMDGPRIVQALSNLLGNAIKFTPRGGSVALTVHTKTEGVVFTVSDTGPGLDPNDVPHLFEKFYQAKSTAKAGSGLGLYIARGVAEAHGGRIWVETSPGGGASFSFTIPFSKTISKSPEERRPPAIH